jgi:hypothetical protein
MKDPYELVSAILILAVAGIMLVTGELYLVTNTGRAPVSSPPAMMSSR